MNSQPRSFKTILMIMFLSLVLSLLGGIPARAMQTSPDAAPPAGLSVEDWSQIQDLLRAALPGQQAYLKASNTGVGDRFGWSVAVSGNTVVVGAYMEDSSSIGVNHDEANNAAPDSGAVYVFIRSGTTWSQQAYLKASNTGAVDYFGVSVAISGDTLVVGAPCEDSSSIGVNNDGDNNAALNSGAAYVFRRAWPTWSQQAYLKASNTGAGDYFGYSVAISGDTVVVGAYLEDSSSIGVNHDGDNDAALDSGAAYVFIRSVTTWSQQAYLKASNTGAGDYFGGSVSASGDTVVVGALGEDSSSIGVNHDGVNDDAPDSGAAYVFIRSVTTWSQQAYLKASNTGAGDYFGDSVAISGDTLVVGASYEDSNSTGVNNEGSNNLAGESGAAYVFTRSGTTWSQQAYVKASNTDAGDKFGESVAIDGATVVVGAYQEDSSATGVDGNQNDNSAAFSGAAYVFTRSGTTWSQQAYLKASNTDAGDRFGSSVAISGDTVMVGAYEEASNATGVNGDQGNDSAGSAGAAYVFVPDLAPTNINLSNSPVAENQPVGTTIGTLSTTDPDPGDSHTYSFACSTPGVDDASFQIISNSLQTNAVFDYETKNTYAICVRTNDGRGGSFDKNFAIQVTDANDAPTGVSLSNSSVAENQPVGTVVGTLTATDQDGGDTHTFALACSAAGADDASFQVSGSSLQTNAIFNYETKNSYGICVRTNDGRGGTFDKNFTIHVTDVIETLTPLVVNSDGDGSDAIKGNGVCETGTGNGVCTLRAAIEEANGFVGADKITFLPTTLNITLGSSLPDITSDLTIDGGGASVTISGNNYLYQVMKIYHASVTLDHLSIVNGVAEYGGGIFASEATLTVMNSTFSGNSGTYGGAICTVAGTLTVTNSTFVDNVGTYGGAICTVAGTLTVTDSTFSGNSATIKGGGIFSDNAPLTVSNSTFSDNATVGDGGAIYIFYDGSPTTLALTNSTFSGNVATNGGALYNSAGTVTIANNTFSRNAAATTGGGIFNHGGILNLKNTILANSIREDCYSNVTLAADTYNLIEVNDGCGTPVSSANPHLGPLANNGGPTQTFALLTGSPALDAGDDATCAAAPVSNKDQRGVTRPFGAHCDIGAYELNKGSLTTRSVGANDGWILESAEASNVGGTLNAAATTFNLGDEAGDKQYRAILSFNTGALPDTAVITKVTLKIKRPATGYLVGNNNPFTWGLGLKVDMRKPFFGTTLGLVISDFQAAAGKTAVATFSSTPVAYWYSAVLNATGRGYINKTGTTQFRLRFAKDDNDDNAADYMKFYSGNYATATARPTLVIEYYVP